MFNISKKSIKKEIAELGEQILNKILDDEKLISKIDSLGIKDGKIIISDFLKNKEYGLAYEHLEYMISESGIELSSSQTEKINFIGKKLK